MSLNFDTTTLEINGVTTVVKSIGSGKPVLFLHGASTLEGFDFAEGLADRFKVLLPSHPGFGYSGDAPRLTGMADMVVHYLNLIDALGLDRPHLMGFSMGGWMAAELATVAREKFDRVVLVAPAGMNDPDFPGTDLGTVAPQDLPGYLAHDVGVALRYFPDGTDAAFGEAFGKDRAREGETLGRLLAPHGMGHPSIRSWIARITNPTLIVWGEHDRIIPVGNAAIWAEAIPNSSVRIVPDAGHFVMQEKPETLTAIGDFLSQ